jgi:phosphopantothenoylcysteine synthetase/decarboxylase
MNKNIILGVTGSIAAFKSVDIYSRLVHTGHKVNVVMTSNSAIFIMTSNSAIFITPLTLEDHSKNKVYIDMFKHEGQSQITRFSTAIDTFLILVVPTAYYILDFLRNGLADWSGGSNG